MAQRNRSGRGGRRRSGGDEGPDLFAEHLSAVVQQAFAATGGEPGAVEAAVPPEAPVEGRGGVPPAEPDVAPDTLTIPPAEPGGAPDSFVTPTVDAPDGPVAPVEVPGLREGEGSGEDEVAAKVEQEEEPLPARMLNEFVYCPRLFYYEHVEGVFMESADTVKGTAVHKTVDKGKGALAQPEGEKPKADGVTSDGRENEGGADSAKQAKARKPEEEIHVRSVMLGSERLGAVAKMDLVDATLTRDGSVAAVQPVDYKVGAPREGAHGRELWDADKMQLGVQCLILRDNGYACDTGLIYYRTTKQRVPLELTPELEAWVMAKIAEARVCAKGPIPPPLVDSPKCVRCSLAPVCLPDETRMLSIPTVENYAPTEEGDGTAPVIAQPAAAGAPRLLMTARDQRKPLYLNTPGFRVGCNDAVLKVKEKDRVVNEVRVMDVCHVALFGNIQISTQAVQRLCEEEIPVTWFSMGGWFYGMTRGHGLKNVLLRIAQFRHAADPASCLRLAQQFVRGKIHNHRVMFMRDHIQPPGHTKLRLGHARKDALATSSLEELLGVEGAAAAEYFAHFGGLIRERNEDAEVPETDAASAAPAAREGAFTFDFTTRNRRPPTDPVNALLSLAYSLLAKECTLAACAVGLDPYVGFYHQPRHGRPALALDVMEEFRPLIAESAVLTAINNRFISTRDFVAAGRAVNLSAAGRKKFFPCFEQRMNALILHPVFDYKVSYRRALELQFRILARVLTGEIPEYVPFLTR